MIQLVHVLISSIETHYTTQVFRLSLLISTSPETSFANVCFHESLRDIQPIHQNGLTRELISFWTGSGLWFWTSLMASLAEMNSIYLLTGLCVLLLACKDALAAFNNSHIVDVLEGRQWCVNYSCVVLVHVVENRQWFYNFHYLYFILADGIQ